jgi:hypothetical protein
MTFLKVEGKEGLVRDPSTNAIINVNQDEYQKYLARRNKKTSDAQRIENLENELSEIKRMLSILINNK